MATIVTRAGKGSPLTNAEVDANFTNLNSELAAKASTASLATVATSGSYTDLANRPTNVSYWTNDAGYLTSISSSQVTTALGYTPANKAGDTFSGAVTFSGGINPNAVFKAEGGAEGGQFLLEKGSTGTTLSGNLVVDLVGDVLRFFDGSGTNRGAYLNIMSQGTGAGSRILTDTTLTSGNVTTALGYTPANKAGDTFTGAITVNNGSHQVTLASDGNIEITRSGGGAYIDFKDVTSEDFDSRIQQSGTGFNLTGTVSAGSDFRAPIFYDSANTAYYVDPNGNSILNGSLTVNGGITGSLSGNASTATTLQTARTISLTGDVTGSVSFNGSANVSITATVADDSHNHTIANVDGLQAALDAKEAADDTILVREGDISTQDWNTYIDGTEASWNTVLNMSGSNRPVGAYGYGTALNFSKAGQAKFQMYVPETASAGASTGGIWYRSGWDTTYRDWVRVLDSAYAPFNGLTDKTGGTGTYTTSGDFRAPIFYDSNNTAYYVDPTGTSVVNGVTFTNSTYYINTDKLLLQHNGTDGYIRAVNAGSDLYLGGSNQNTLTLHTGNYAVIAGSTRSPIFYDSNNTAYLIDGDGTSGLNVLRLNELRTFGGNFLVINAGESNAYATGQTGEVLYLNAEGGIQINSSPDNWASGWDGRYTATICNTSGDSFFPTRVTAGTDFRAPIFYDSNNTAYFVDPASTAGNAAYFAGGIHISGANVTGNGLILADDGDIVDMNDGYCSMRFSNGIRIRNGNRTGDPAYELNSVYGASSLENQRGFVINGNYTDGRYSTRLRKWDDGGGVPLYIQQTTGTAGSWSNVASFGASNSRYAFHVDGIMYTGSDVRASQFVDANDTTWYLDPNGTSRVYRFKVAGETEYPGSINGDYEGGYYHFGPSDNTPTGGYGHAHIIRLSADWNVQMFFPTSNTNEPMWLRRKQNGTYSAWRRLLQEDEWIGSKYLASDGRIFGTILYDSNNTGYYVDPNSTSNLLNLNANYIRSYGNVDVDNDLVVGTASGKTASYIYMKDADEGDRIIHCNSNRIGFLNQAGGWGSWCDDEGYWQTDFSVRAPIFYDSNDTSTYVNPNGTSWFKGNIYNWRQGASNDTFGGLELREADGVANAQSAATYAPGINFHWSMRAAARIYMNASGNFVLGAQSDITNGRRALYLSTLFAANDVHAQIYYDSNDTGYYANPNGTSRLSTLALGGAGSCPQGAIWSAGNFWLDGNGRKIAFTTDGSTDDNGNVSIFAWGNDFRINNWSGSALNDNFYVFGASRDAACAGNITAYYSDDRLKTKTGTIADALTKVASLEGFTYVENETARSVGYANDRQQVGVSAQAVQAVLPEAVHLAPFDYDVAEDGTITSKSGENYLTVDYSRIVPLLIEAIKELKIEVETLKATAY